MHWCDLYRNSLQHILILKVRPACWGFFVYLSQLLVNCLASFQAAAEYEESVRKYLYVQWMISRVFIIWFPHMTASPRCGINACQCDACAVSACFSILCSRAAVLLLLLLLLLPPYVRGGAAAQCLAAARWDGCAEGCDTDRRNFQRCCAKQRTSHGWNRAATETPTPPVPLMRVLFAFFFSFFLFLFGCVNNTHRPVRSTCMIWESQVSRECKHEQWVWCPSHSLYDPLHIGQRQTGEAAFHLHKAAERQRDAGCCL